jgi:hypothetical protein
MLHLDRAIAGAFARSKCNIYLCPVPKPLEIDTQFS